MHASATPARWAGGRSVDRMINDPDECETLLTQGNLTARLTHDEHVIMERAGREGRDLFARMLSAPVADLIDLGLERYRRVGIEVVTVAQTPSMI